MNFEQTILRIMNVTLKDPKGIDGMMIKTFEEGGELAEAVNIHTGAIKHKTTKEPLVGEVADLVQCAIAVLVRATPDLTGEARAALLLEWLNKKTDKWEAVIDSTQVKKFVTLPKCDDDLRQALAGIGIQVVTPGPVTPPKAVTLAKALQNEGLVPQTPPTRVVKVKPLPKVHVTVRKHPAGIKQPLGYRRVWNIDFSKPGRANVFLQGGSWDLDLSKQTPSFLTFHVDGSKKPCTLQDAAKYWHLKTYLKPLSFEGVQHPDRT